MALPAVTTPRLGAPSWPATATRSDAGSSTALLASPLPGLSDKEHARRGGSGAAGVESPSRAPFHPTIVPPDQDRLLESFLEASWKRDRDRMQTLSDGTWWRVQREEGRASSRRSSRDAGNSRRSAYDLSYDLARGRASHAAGSDVVTEASAAAEGLWPEWRVAAEEEAARYFPLARDAALRRARGRLAPEQHRRVKAAAAAAVEAPALCSSTAAPKSVPRPSQAPLHALRRRLQAEDEKRARQQRQVRADWEVLRREPPKPQRPLGAFTQEQRRTIGEDTFAMVGEPGGVSGARPRSPLRSRAFASPRIRPPSGTDSTADGAAAGTPGSPQQAPCPRPTRSGSGSGAGEGEAAGAPSAARKQRSGGGERRRRRPVRKRMTASERENHPFAPNRPFRWRDPGGRAVQLRQWRRAWKRERVDREEMEAREEAWRYAEWLKQRGSVRAAGQAEHRRDVARAQALARRRRIERRAEREAALERERERRGAAVYQQRHGRLAQPRPQEREVALQAVTGVGTGRAAAHTPSPPTEGVLLNSGFGGGGGGGGGGGAEGVAGDHSPLASTPGTDADWGAAAGGGESHPLARLLAADTPAQSASDAEAGATAAAPPPTLTLPSPPVSEGRGGGGEGKSGGTPEHGSEGSQPSARATHARPLASLLDSTVAAAAYAGEQQQQQQQRGAGRGGAECGTSLADYVKGVGWPVVHAPLRPPPATAEARSRRWTVRRPPSASSTDRRGAARGVHDLPRRPATEHGRRHGSLAAADGSTLARLQVDDMPSLAEAQWLRSDDEASLDDFGRQLDPGEPSLGNEARESASRASSATDNASSGTGHVAGSSGGSPPGAVDGASRTTPAAFAVSTTAQDSAQGAGEEKEEEESLVGTLRTAEFDRKAEAYEREASLQRRRFRGSPAYYKALLRQRNQSSGSMGGSAHDGASGGRDDGDGDGDDPLEPEEEQSGAGVGARVGAERQRESGVRFVDSLLAAEERVEEGGDHRLDTAAPMDSGDAKAEGSDAHWLDLASQAQGAGLAPLRVVRPSGASMREYGQYTDATPHTLPPSGTGGAEAWRRGLEGADSAAHRASGLQRVRDLDRAASDAVLRKRAAAKEAEREVGIEAMLRGMRRLQRRREGGGHDQR